MNKKTGEKGTKGKMYKEINFEAAYAWIADGNDVEFEYSGKRYVIDSQGYDEKNYIWMSEFVEGRSKRIVEREIPLGYDVPKTDVDAILSEKCLDRKSFFELEKEGKIKILFWVGEEGNI